MNTIRLRNQIWLLFGCIAMAGCGPTNEDHVFGVGKSFTLTKFKLIFATGNSYSFSKAELEQLEQAWSFGNVGVDTTNDIMHNGTRIDYQFALSDGFETAFNGSILKIDGDHYLYLALLGNGGGFPGDVISHVIKLDDVLDDARINELFELTDHCLLYTSPSPRDRG